ncbi:Mediator of RNA polymerase II transcription subunit 1 [Oopsacas minuta]|uniref:Mediator of RNA polymerase II transcription subunit 1 n=1 Tax=Oopsacas minuta TaxID=111878 RepID=A0AAV7JHK4_9METZ|nr:Mediator of RNA polymerase II transcription subunit 1 [Oopsacas minuta]
MTMTMDFLLSESRLKQIVEEIRLRLERGRQAEAQDPEHRFQHVEGNIQAANRTHRDLEYCLDRLSEAVRPTSAAVVVCCLESLGRQTGLNFIHYENNIYFLSCKPFYIEISLGPNGEILSTNIGHGGAPPGTCSTLFRTLQKWDISAAKAQLKSLVNLYSTPIHLVNKEEPMELLDTTVEDPNNSSTDPIIYNILQALGADLSLIVSQIHCSEEEAIMHGPIGLLSRPDGGFPAKLSFFKLPNISPGNLTAEQKTLSAEIILYPVPCVGDSLSLCMHNLQNLNSEAAKYCHAKELDLSVAYCLKLATPIPLSDSSMHFIRQISNSSSGLFVDTTREKSLLGCLAPEQTKGSSGQLNQYSLPLENETHYYFISLDEVNNKACMIEQILFNNAKMLISIIQVLRRQLVYNTMVSSLVTFCSSKDLEVMREKNILWRDESQNGVERIFDISFNPVESIMIEFQHPIHLAVQVKLYIILHPKNPSQPEVKVEMLVEGYLPEISSSQILDYTLTQCLLLPPLLHMIIKYPDKLLGPSPLSQQASFQQQQAAITAPIYLANTSRTPDSKSGHKRKIGGICGVEEMEEKRLK